MSELLSVEAMPSPFLFDPAHTALVLIDMQRDFVEPGGFGETLGNDVTMLHSVIPPLKAVLADARDRGITVIHTREGHRARSVRLPTGEAPSRGTLEADRRPRAEGAHPGPG